MTIESDKFSIYAPIRQRGLLWWKYAQLAAKDGHVVANGMISSMLPSLIDDFLTIPYLTKFSEVTKNQPNSDYLLGVHIAKIEMLRDWVPLAAQYELCGRQIFDLHDGLVEMLRETDLGECTLENWNAPYEAFYVRFGKQEPIKIQFEGDEYEYLDGAFIARTPYDNKSFRLKFGFTTVKENGQGVMIPGYFIDFLPDEQKLPVQEAIETALARRLAQSDDHEGDSENERAINSHRRVEVADSIDLLRTGATLLVNSLFYLERLGSSVPNPEPGRDTPPEHVARWFQADEKKRHKQKSALTANGYALVRLVGREVLSSGLSR